MGVEVRIIAYAKDQAACDVAVKAAYDRVADLETCMSDYMPDSELMRLCAKAGAGPVPVSDDLFRVLAYAREVSEASAGAFDVTVGPLVQLWRTARKIRSLPAGSALADARSRVGWKLMRLDEKHKTVELTVPGMRLDLGGIAKGFAGDEVIRILQAHGIKNALFEAGGDIVVSAPPPGKRGWTVDVTDPESTNPRTISLKHSAVSTSGDTMQFVEIDGIRYSHVVDPRSGLGLSNQYLTTVRARRGITTDALSTAATVLGPRDGAQLVKRFAATAFIRKS